MEKCSSNEACAVRPEVYTWIAYTELLQARAISPQTSSDLSLGSYILRNTPKTMIHIVYIMICGQPATC